MHMCAVFVTHAHIPSSVYPPPKNFKSYEFNSLTGDVTTCRLWCKVKHVSDSNQTEVSQLVNRPYVHWEKQDKRKKNGAYEFHPLSNVLYWYTEERLTFTQSLRYYCNHEGSNVYDCGTAIEYCANKYLGKYRCSVYDFDSGFQVQQNVDLIQSDANNTCYMPRAENITANLITDENGTHHINVSWEFAERPKDLKYCATSRQWQIRSFNSSTPYSFEDGQEPLNTNFRTVKFQNTTGKRETFFVFKIEKLQRNHYYQFQVQNKKRKGTTEVYEARNYTSQVYTFEDQRELH